MLPRIYFDSASTTNVNKDVLKTYIDILNKHYANSESLYDEGTIINQMMEKSRAATAGILGISPNEIIFTSGSSEANSSAIKGVCFAIKKQKHILTTNVEHSSILNCCAQMKDIFGYEVTYLPVNNNGVVTLEQVKQNLREDTAIVSIMYVNNESGSINPIKEIAEYVKKHSHAYMHVDFTQAIGKVPLDFENIDLASISAHKMEGLKGSGILIKKTHVPFVPLINGGEQEQGLRGGTSNAPVNIVFAKTLRLYLEKCQKNHNNLLNLNKHLIEGLKEIPDVELNSTDNSVINIINFSYEKIPSEVMQNALNRSGFMVSARSTCASKSNNPSYVLKAMGYSDARANSCIRISLSSDNTIDEIDEFLKSLKEIIKHYG